MIVIYEGKRYVGNFAALQSTRLKSTEFITYHFIVKKLWESHKKFCGFLRKAEL